MNKSFFAASIAGVIVAAGLSFGVSAPAAAEDCVFNNAKFPCQQGGQPQVDPRQQQILRQQQQQQIQQQQFQQQQRQQQDQQRQQWRQQQDQQRQQQELQRQQQEQLRLQQQQQEQQRYRVQPQQNPDYNMARPQQQYDGRGRDEYYRRHHRWRPVIIEQPAPVYVEPPVVYDAPQRPAYRSGQWVRCAREHGACDVPYPTRVRYGRNGRYVYLDVDQPITCDNGTFGRDPARGSLKRCDFLAD